MIVREEGAASAEVEQTRDLRSILAVLGACAHRLVVRHDPSDGFEVVSADNPRPRIRFFRPSAGGVAAFFYKPSRLSFSRDRFSYGVLHLHEVETPRAREDLVAAIDYLASGFNPARRPRRLRRAHPFDVPED